MNAKIRALAGLALASTCLLAHADYKAKFLERSKAWGSTVADWNNDGKQDFWVCGHDANDRPWYWDGKGYSAGAQVMEFVDRHDCDSADVNHDGLIDIYCQIGGEKGTGYKANELWMRQPDGTFLLAQNHGAEDPTGRGRIPIFFDLNHDGWADLYVTVLATERPDHQPNINHVFVNQKDGTFAEHPTIATGPRGDQCAAKGDVNGDGWDDLVVCYEKGPAHVYVNNKQSDFTELVNATLLAVEWRDAKLVDLNGDGYDDLVVGTDTSLFQIWMNTKKAPWFDKPLVNVKLPGRINSVAVGDFNKDGHKDVYVVLADKDCDTTGVDAAPDVVFWGNADGTYTQETLTQQAGYAGCGHLADVVDGSKVLLENGDVGHRGPQYIITWK
jgi:hypothetical protein